MSRMTLNNPTGRTAILSKEELLHRVWRHEVNRGVDVVEVCERMMDFSKLLDGERDDFRVINSALERTR